EQHRHRLSDVAGVVLSGSQRGAAGIAEAGAVGILVATVGAGRHGLSLRVHERRDQIVDTISASDSTATPQATASPNTDSASRPAPVRAIVNPTKASENASAEPVSAITPSSCDSCPLAAAPIATSSSVNSETARLVGAERFIR